MKWGENEMREREGTWGNYRSCKKLSYFLWKKRRQEIFCGHVKQKGINSQGIVCGASFFQLTASTKILTWSFFCISIEEFKNIFTLLQKLDFWHCHTIHFCKHAVKYSPFFRSNLHSNNSLQLAISEREKKNGKEMKKLH